MPQLKPTRGIRLNKSHPLARGLVGCWLFNEGSGDKVYDLSGNGNIGTLQGNKLWSPGKFGSAWEGDGEGDYITVPHKSNLAVASGSFTVIASIAPDDVTTRNICAKYAANDEDFVIYFSSTSTIRFLNRDLTATLYLDSNKTSWNLGQHYHIACIFDKIAPARLIYIDGIFDASDVPSDTITPNSGNFIIGTNNATNDFDGLIDYVMIFNRALSTSEIALLYREPFCMFEEAMRPELIGGQIVNLAGSSVALSSLTATAKATRKIGGNVVSTSDVAAILNLIRSLQYIESNWKREALFNGMTANAFKLGTTLSLGWFWVRVAGCSVLYRGSSMGEIDIVNILAVAEQDACEISPPSYISHNSGSTYFYVVRRFNDCGYQERTLAASVKISIESNGELAEPQPNKVFDSGAELVDGNKILLVWYYCPLEQKSQPMCFNIYYDGRTGQINYENPLAIIGYKGRKFYSYQCGALEAGRYLFAIRTEDASGIENSSLARLRIQFDPTNPDAIDILSVEGV